jgi:hypothetical protein
MVIMCLNVVEHQLWRDIDKPFSRYPEITRASRKPLISRRRTKLAEMWPSTNNRLPRVAEVCAKCIEKVVWHDTSRERMIMRKPTNCPNVRPAVHLALMTEVWIKHETRKSADILVPL